MRRATLVGGIVVALAAAAGSASAQVRVAGFRPSDNGFQFANQWPQQPYGTINVAGVQVPIGNASKGICGGMVFAVRDYFESGMHVPLTATNPAYNTPLYNYLVGRLFDSFTTTAVANDYFLQSTPLDSDRQNAMRQQWPFIKADLDAGMLSPMTLIRLRWDLNPFDLGENHQVLAYGYDLSNGGTVATIYLYDPNHPGDDHNSVTYDMNAGTATQTTGETVTSFFRVDYVNHTPLATQSWLNGFEGAAAGAWFMAGHAGVEIGGTVARTGSNEGWVEATTGWNAVNAYVPLLPGRTCDMRAYVQTSYGLINGYVSMRSVLDNHILDEAHVVGGTYDGVYYGQIVEFTADSNYGLFYTGLWGTGADTWLRVDDVEVVCQTW